MRQLQAVYNLLLRLDDPLVTPEELEALQRLTSNTLQPLEEFLSTPPPPPSQSVPRQEASGRGRPSYKLSLQRAQRLHALGNSWADVAAAIGVNRKTLYNHLRSAGLSSSRPAHTDISDD